MHAHHKYTMCDGQHVERRLYASMERTSTIQAYITKVNNNF